MERFLKRIADKELNQVGDFIFRNALGNPIIFDSAPSLVEMKANTWGKVKDTDTAIYVKFADGHGVTITTVALT